MIPRRPEQERRDLRLRACRCLYRLPTLERLHVLLLSVGDSVPATQYGPVSTPPPPPPPSFLPTAEGQQYGCVRSRLSCARAAISLDAGAVCQETGRHPLAVGTPCRSPADRAGHLHLPQPARSDWIRAEPAHLAELDSSAVYEGIQYSCGKSGDTRSPGDTSQGGQCVALIAPGQNPVLTIVVIANGGSTYTIQYNSDGNVR
jgi:hypothetical protein